MAKKKTDDAESQVGRVKAAVNRGTQDELEILRFIVLETSTVRPVVMDKLRSAQARASSRGDTNTAVKKRNRE